MARKFYNYFIIPSICVLLSECSAICAEGSPASEKGKTAVALPAPGSQGGKSDVTGFDVLLSRIATKNPRIKELSLLQEDTRVEVRKGLLDSKSQRSGVYLDAIYTGEGGSLAGVPSSYRMEQDRTDPNHYRLFIPINAKTTFFKVFVVRPTGEVQQENFQLVSDNWEKLSRTVEAPLTERKASLGSEQKSLSLGITKMDFRQTYYDPVNATLLTLKLGISGDLVNLLDSKSPPSRWGWGIMGFGTLAPLSVSIANTSVRFLGFNLRGSYAIPVPPPWGLRFSIGYYYTTMLVNSSDPTVGFGFQNQVGPQFMPSVSRMIGKGNVISSYFKLAFVGDSPVSFTDISSRETAFGVNFSKMLKDGIAMTAAYDRAWLRTRIDDVTIQSDTQSVSLGLIFGGN